MGRKAGKSSKKSVSFQEPEKKRAKTDAQQKNAAELKKLLASKTDLNLGPNDHVFVDGAAPAKGSKLSLDDSLASGVGDKDPLADEVLGVSTIVARNPLGDEDHSSDESDAESKDDEHSEIEDQDVGFPKPIKESLNDSDSGEDSEETTKPQEARIEKEPEVVKTRTKPSSEFLMTVISGQKEKIRKQKTKCKALEEEIISLKNLTVRLSEENVALKDSRAIPMAKFTTVPGINVTVADLEQMSNQGGGSGVTTSVFVSMLLVKLVGVERLRKTSVTGKACQRFVNSRNADGTPTHPAQDKLDPKILNFICDKVAERTAIRHGAANAVLIRAESNENKIRKIIGIKIGNLKKPKREIEPENSSSESEEEEKEKETQM